MSVDQPVFHTHSVGAEVNVNDHKVGARESPEENNDRLCCVVDLWCNFIFNRQPKTRHLKYYSIDTESREIYI